jgi:hypothetical protein
VLALQLGEPLAATGAVIVIATTLLAGVPQLRAWAPPLGALAVIVAFVVAEHFDDQARTAVMLAGVALGSGALSARLSRTSTRLQGEGRH